MDAFVDADLAFHLAVADASHNDLLRRFYHLSRKLVADVVSEMVQALEVREDAVRLQFAIAEAIRHTKPAKARAAALCHMTRIEPVF